MGPPGPKGSEGVLLSSFFLKTSNFLFVYGKGGGELGYSDFFFPLQGARLFGQCSLGRHRLVFLGGVGRVGAKWSGQRSFVAGIQKTDTLNKMTHHKSKSLTNCP